jgi:TonB family protein
MRRLILTFALSLSARGAQPTLEIVEPADASVIRPGDTVVVSVRASKTYAEFWLDGDRALNVKGAPAASPPYRFSFRVPGNIIAGLYRVWAIGCNGAALCDRFEPITVDVEPIWPDEPSPVADAPGVSVDTGGVPIAGRPVVTYPKGALERAIGGTILVEVTPDSEGHVEGVQVLSGPIALQKDVIKAVLTWQFPTQAGRKPRQIRIQFDPVQAGRAAAENRFQRQATSADDASPITDVRSGSTTRVPELPAPSRIRVSAEMQAAKLISKVDPVYPPIAKAAHIQGVVRFSAIIGTDGRVENILLLKGPPLLADAARNAASQWTYSPTFVNAKAVEVVTEIEVEFLFPSEN